METGSDFPFAFPRHQDFAGLNDEGNGAINHRCVQINPLTLPTIITNPGSIPESLQDVLGGIEIENSVPSFRVYTDFSNAFSGANMERIGYSDQEGVKLFWRGHS